MKTSYHLSVIEATVKEVYLEGLEPVRWLIALGYEKQDGIGRWVGTVWSDATKQAIRVGKNGEVRRVMKSPVEAMTWFKRMVAA